MIISPQDFLYFFALPVEQISATKTVEVTRSSWEHVLAKARTHFIYDGLIRENGLEEGNDGHVLEVDHGISKLGKSLQQKGLASVTVRPKDMIGVLQERREYSVGVSHNNLEHIESLHGVDFVVSAMARVSKYGMVHQVHAVDDPAFEWDSTHHIRLTGDDWEAFFANWALEHKEEGWTYLGNHRGASGRPKNHILERNGSLPFYADYDKQLMRQIVSELTLANGISIARIPLLLASFDIAQDNPYVLAGLVGVIHSLDAADGYAARKGFGNSRYGPFVDIAVDHVSEIYIAYQFAYEMGIIPKSMPWILSARNMSVDFLRFYNGVTKSFSEEAHPHKAFGTTGKKGRQLRGLYGGIKALGDMIIPIIPRSGVAVSTVHAIASIYRAMPVWNSPRAREISKELFERVKGTI